MAEKDFAQIPEELSNMVSSLVLFLNSAVFMSMSRHHRQKVMEQIPSLPSDELSFLAQMFSKDAKNYHVWTYRTWLVRHFSLWDGELPYVETLLEEDVRNNSAWNHRWYVVFGRYMDPKKHSIKNGDSDAEVEPEIFDREIMYTEKKIDLAPQNQSPWNYLKGVLTRKG